jgi:hypothetical protein
LRIDFGKRVSAIIHIPSFISIGEIRHPGSDPSPPFGWPFRVHRTCSVAMSLGSELNPGQTSETHQSGQHQKRGDAPTHSAPARLPAEALVDAGAPPLLHFHRAEFEWGTRHWRLSPPLRRASHSRAAIIEGGVPGRSLLRLALPA